MNIKEIIVWILVLLTVCVFIYFITRDIYLVSSYEGVEHMINVPKIDHNEPKWSRTSSCKYDMDRTTTSALNNTNITNTTDYTKADIVFPCGYNNIDDEIKSLPTVYHKLKSSSSHPIRVF